MPPRSLLLALAALVLAATAALAGFLVARALRPAPDFREPELPAIGDLRPELRLPDLSGRVVDLDAYAGKPLLLNFWASWCPPCVKEMPVLDAFARSHPGIQVIGVAVEPAQAARDHLAAHPVSYPVLIGSDGSPDESQRFGNQRSVLPFTVLVDAEGRIRKRHSGGFDAASLEDFAR